MTNSLDFGGKVALVTEASSGMGLATARAFAEARKLVAAGHKAIPVQCDVSDDAQAAAMLDRTVAGFGRPRRRVHHAGVMARIAPTADSTREEWDRVIGINLRGVWSSMKSELRQMERQGIGAIDTQIARDVVNGEEQANSEIAKHVPIARGQARGDRLRPCCGFCSLGASYVVGHARTVDGGMTVA